MNKKFTIGLVIFIALVVFFTQSNLKVTLPPNCLDASTDNNCICYQGDRESHVVDGVSEYTCKILNEVN